jgi:hypothetical protein
MRDTDQCRYNIILIHVASGLRPEIDNDAEYRGKACVSFNALAVTGRVKEEAAPHDSECRLLPYDGPPGARVALLRSPILPTASERIMPDLLMHVLPVTAHAQNSKAQPPRSALSFPDQRSDQGLNIDADELRLPSGLAW